MATQLQTTDGPAPAVPALLTREAENFALTQRKARMFSMSPLVPQHLRNGGPEQAMANCYIALTLADAMGEMPLIVMQNIHVINGKAGFASKYMIARANASGKFRDDLDWEIEGAGPTLSATCFATLAKSGRRVEMKVDMAMAKAEGWTKNAKYQSMPELMLRYRSASFLVNLYAPEVMLGYRSTEELEDMRASGVIDVEESQPLTVAAITHQAAGAPGEDVTGLVEDVEIVPEGRTDDQHGDQSDGTNPDHPFRAIADGLIERAGSVTTIIDLKAIETELAQDRDAAPEDLVAEVDAAIGAARERLTAK